MSTSGLHRRIYGQYFTPQAVVTACYALLAGAFPLRRIVDPACGDGAFLRYAADHHLAACENLYGCDVDETLVQTLVAAGLSQVCCADGLAPASLEDGAFDLVIGNPPFGVTTPQPAGRLASEVRFLLRALDLARPGGYIALVLPHGVLANERLHDVRTAVLRICTVHAVIALPRSTFRQAGTDASCSILLLQKCAPPDDHAVFFAMPPQLDDLPAVVAAYHNGRRGTAHGRGAVETVYWLPQTAALARRLDAPFWQPAYRHMLERMAGRYPLAPLGDVADRRRNLIAGDHVRPSRGESKGPGCPYEYYQTREFMAAGYNYARLEHCNEQAYRRLRHTAVQQHDVLVSCAGVGGVGNGRVCLVTHRPGPSCTGDVFILRVRMPDPIFLFLFLASRGGRMQLLRLQNGVGTANLSADELLQVQIPLVPVDVQRAFARRYAPVAAAHDLAMAALARGESDRFQACRMQAERRRRELIDAMERLCDLEEGNRCA